MFENLRTLDRCGAYECWADTSPALGVLRHSACSARLLLFRCFLNHVIRAHLGRVVVVIFVRRHRLFVIERPGPLLGGYLAQHSPHLPEVGSYRTATCTDVVDPV